MKPETNLEKDWRSIAGAGLAMALAMVAVYPLAHRFIILSDEGLILQQAVDLLHGKVLYRDMDAFVSPGIWYLVAALFSLVPPSIFAARLLALAAYGVTAFVAYRIVNRLASARAAWVAIAGLTVAYVWAFPAWTFAFYSSFAILFALMALDTLLAWRTRQNAHLLILTGVWAGLSIAFKQNYGAGALIGLCAAVYLIRVESGTHPFHALRQSLFDALLVASGVALVLLPIVLYFTYRGGAGDLFNSLVVHPFFFASHQNIPYLTPWQLVRTRALGGVARLTYGAVPWVHLGSPFDWFGPTPVGDLAMALAHAFLYWIPPALFAYGGIHVLRPVRATGKPDAALGALVLVGTGLFLGVLPRADFAHLVNVYQPVVILLAVLGYRVMQRPVIGTIFRAARILATTAVVAYCGLALFWYNRMRVQDSTVLLSDRGGVHLNPIEAELLDDQVEFIRSVTAEGEAVLTVPDLAMLNFLADRPEPSRYYNLYEHHIAHDEGAEVVRATEAKHVRWVVARYDNFFSDHVPMRIYAPVLWRYLRDHFEIVFTRSDNGILFLRRRVSARSPATSHSLLEYCKLPPDEKGEAVPAWTREHLLFSTLYMVPPPLAQATTVHCGITVPPNTVLAVGSGYRKPETADPGTEAVAEIRVTGVTNTLTLLNETRTVTASTTWMDHRWTEHIVDLSRFAGKRVDLSFSVRLLGAVDMPFLDRRRFAFEWVAPRIESRPEQASIGKEATNHGAEDMNLPHNAARRESARWERTHK